MAKPEQRQIKFGERLIPWEGDMEYGEPIQLCTTRWGTMTRKTFHHQIDAKEGKP